MGFILFAAAWIVLFMIAWPIALFFAVLLPIFWLLSIPFRIFGIVVESLLAFIRAVLMLPARVLGHR
jgi:hypothetical protein